MGSYKYGYKSPNMGYNYRYLTYNPTNQCFPDWGVLMVSSIEEHLRRKENLTSKGIRAWLGFRVSGFRGFRVSGFRGLGV